MDGVDLVVRVVHQRDAHRVDRLVDLGDAHRGEHPRVQRPEPHLAHHVGVVARDAAGEEPHRDASARDLLPAVGRLLQDQVPRGAVGDERRHADDHGRLGLGCGRTGPGAESGERGERREQKRAARARARRGEADRGSGIGLLVIAAGPLVLCTGRSLAATLSRARGLYSTNSSSTRAELEARALLGQQVGEPLRVLAAHVHRERLVEHLAELRAVLAHDAHALGEAEVRERAPPLREGERLVEVLARPLERAADRRAGRLPADEELVDRAQLPALVELERAPRERLHHALVGAQLRVVHLERDGSRPRHGRPVEQRHVLLLRAGERRLRVALQRRSRTRESRAPARAGRSRAPAGRASAPAPRSSVARARSFGSTMSASSWTQP